MKQNSLTFLFLMFTVNLLAQTSDIKINIVFIGNSITYGANLINPRSEAPPVKTVNKLQIDGYKVGYANCACSGKTTVDFLPESKTLYQTVIQAADTLYKEDRNLLIFSIMLGTNDSAIKGTNGAPVSPEKYKENLRVIIDSLHNRYPGSYFVLHRPLWYSPNTHNAATYLEEGLNRLQTYTPVLEALAKEKAYILTGDRDGYNLFKRKATKYFVAENGNSGTFYLHPNAVGAKILGELWAKNISRHLKKELPKKIKL